jgi:hypothetical protein
MNIGIFRDNVFSFNYLDCFIISSKDETTDLNGGYLPSENAYSFCFFEAKKSFYCALSSNFLSIS